jgi:signal transduction histidine kinase
MGMDGPAAVADGRITVRAARLAGSVLAATTFLVTAAGLALMAWDWSTPVPAGYFGFRGCDGVLAVAFGGIGALLTSRRPRHPIGWLFATAAILLAASFATFEYGLAATAGHSLPAVRYVGWFQLFAWVLFLVLLTVYVFLLFPTGRLPDPRWRPVGWLGGAFALLATVGVATTPGGETPNLPGLRNPFGITPAAIPFTLTVAGLAGMLSCAVLAAWSLVARARRGQAVERQQVKWLAYSGCLVAPALVPAVGLSLTKGLPARIAAGVLIVAMATMPVAIAVAVLRYRLYDLDIVVRKTVVAALVAGTFTAIYALVVAGAGALIGQHGSGLLTFAAAALAAAALQSARVRAGLLADRLVYGKRATPYEVLTEFSGQVAGTGSIADVLPRMARLLGEATGAERAEVWMRDGRDERLMACWPAALAPASPDSEPVAGEPTAARDDETAGRGHVFEVVHQGERLGSLRVVTSPREPLTSAAERLIQAVSGQAGLVLRNVALIEDVRSSRHRLVAAADEARRGLERDLHDGAQQQLIAIRINLGLVRQAVKESPEEAAELLAQTEQAATGALAELRDLAHGIYPPLLADHGLDAALAAQARKAPFPVTVESDGTGRYPQETEAAVYFAIGEALQNVAKYAQASGARVTLRGIGRSLTFTVEDDGKGFDPATARMGAGVQGMTDRMAALGGTLEVSSEPGRGTRVTGTIPVSSLAVAE